jgi:hypothetical protein
MIEEKKVVDLAVEPTPQIDRTPVAQEAVPEVAPQPEPATEIPSVPDQVPVTPPVQAVPDVDEFGVPWKNRAMEYRRKLEDTVDKLPQLIDEKLKTISQPQTPQYTYEQLEAYKLQNSTDASIVAWATGEQRKMQQAENRRLFEEVVGSREQVNKTELAKQQALQYVQATYPEAFRKDQSGRLSGWDENSPMTQTIRSLMQTPELMNHPNGLAAAADIAFGRLARTQTPILQQKVQQAKADVKQAQKASLTEGSGRKITTTTPPQVTAIESLRKTGSLRDAEQAIGAILRQKGILGE